jgi:TrpR-related protein YerC/YecD
MKIHQKRTSQALKDSEGLFEAIAAIKDPKEAKNFLKDLCTPAEIQAMTARWRVVALLKKGKSYREIYQETKVSVTTIGRVARYLMLGEGGYHIIYERLAAKKK